MQPLPLVSATNIRIEPAAKPTYSAHFHVSPSAQMDLISVQAGAGKVLRLKQIIFTNLGQQTTAGIVDITFGYASALGSGGSAHGAAHNYGAGDGDPPSTSTARMGDTTPAAGFVAWGHFELFVPGAKTQQTPYDFQFEDSHKPPTVKGDDPAINTIVIRHGGAAGALDMTGFIEWTEEVVP